MKKHTLLIPLLLFALIPAACTGVSFTPSAQQPPAEAPSTTAPTQPTGAPPATATPKPAGGLKVLEVTFAHGLTEEMAPVDPGEEFTPDATIYLSVKLKGRPKEGRVTARFLYQDQEFAATTVDLAQEWKEQGLIFAVGGNTFVGFTLKPEETLPISEDYRVELLLNDTPAGSYAFKVVPPPEAIPSRVRQATLARGATEDYAPIEPGNVFTPQEKVYLVGRVDLGLYSTLKVRWYVDGKPDEAGTRAMTAQENLEDAGFYFSFIPDGGWPEGEHRVALLIDGQEVASYPFTVQAKMESRMWTPYKEALGFFAFSRPPQLDQEQELTEPPVGYMFKSSATGEGLLFVYSDVTDAGLEALFREFIQGLRVKVFGENPTAAVERGQDAQGFPVTIVEFTSEDGARKGLEVVWEPQQGIQAYFLWMAPAELWDERYRDEMPWRVFQSLRWSPERIREYYDRFYLTPTPAGG